MDGLAQRKEALRTAELLGKCLRMVAADGRERDQESTKEDVPDCGVLEEEPVTPTTIVGAEVLEVPGAAGEAVEEGQDRERRAEPLSLARDSKGAEYCSLEVRRGRKRKKTSKGLIGAST